MRVIVRKAFDSAWYKVGEIYEVTELNQDLWLADHNCFSISKENAELIREAGLIGTDNPSLQKIAEQLAEKFSYGMTNQMFEDDPVAESYLAGFAARDQMDQWVSVLIGEIIDDCFQWQKDSRDNRRVDQFRADLIAKYSPPKSEV